MWQVSAQTVISQTKVGTYSEKKKKKKTRSGRRHNMPKFATCRTPGNRLINTVGTDEISRRFMTERKTPEEMD